MCPSQCDVLWAGPYKRPTTLPVDQTRVGNLWPSCCLPREVTQPDHVSGGSGRRSKKLSPACSFSTASPFFPTSNLSKIYRFVHALATSLLLVAESVSMGCGGGGTNLYRRTIAQQLGGSQATQAAVAVVVAVLVIVVAWHG